MIRLCACCDKPIEEFPTDWAQAWPRAYFQIPEKERVRRVGRIGGGDFVVIDSGTPKRRDFLRGVLYVPINDTDLRMGFGLYAEMSFGAIQQYVNDYWDKVLEDAPGVAWKGKLSATRVPLYPELDGLDVQVKLDPSPNRRPNFFAPEGTRAHDDQQSGVTVERWHEYVRMMKGPARGALPPSPPS